MNESLITAGVGLIGAIIGGVASYLGVNKQLKFEGEKIIAEEKEKLEVALAIIKAFLIKEIKSNYEIIESGDKSGELMRMLRGEMESTTRSIGNFSFSYTDFERIKYDIIKYNVKEVLDTIDIYQTFRIIQDKGTERHFTLAQNDKEFIKKGIIKCENMIKSP